MNKRLENLKNALDTIVNQTEKTAKEIQDRATKMIARNASLNDPDDEVEEHGVAINASAAELLSHLPHVHAAAASAAAAARPTDAKADRAPAANADSKPAA